MTDRPDPAVCGFPAPGSRVAGSPPALKRALTPADGVLHASTQDRARADEPTAAPEPARPVPGRRFGSFTAAAAMAGVAVGLELARLSARHRVRCYSRQVNS